MLLTQEVKDIQNLFRSFCHNLPSQTRTNVVVRLKFKVTISEEITSAISTMREGNMPIFNTCHRKSSPHFRTAQFQTPFVQF